MKLGMKEKMVVVGNKGGYPLLENEKKEQVQLDEKKNLKKGTELEVFLYDNHEIYATLDEPALELGQMKELMVAATTKLGAFLQWGLKKDLFLPFSEQNGSVKQGQRVFVILYLDKSNRLCASMKIQNFLSTNSPYEENDSVEGVIYNYVPEIGYFLAVENKYLGLLRREQVKGAYEIGESLQLRVMNVKEDGRLDLSLRQRAHLQITGDAKTILDILDQHGGFMPTNDKSRPEEIRKIYGLSKAAYKRACGHLLKEDIIEFYKDGIQRTRR